MATPIFVQRIARLPQLMNVLSAYPDGLSLRVLASQFGTDEEQLRQDLVTFLDVESWGWTLDIFRRPLLEFLGPDGDPGDPESAPVVRVVDARPSETMGVEYLSAGDLALIYTAGLALLDIDPDDSELAGALAVLAETMYGEQSSGVQPGAWNRFLTPLRKAHEEKRRVKIVYSRAWTQGVSERVIEPLRLMQTQRGWEVDAGPVGPEGNLRTFLLSNIRSVEVLDDTFEPPVSLGRLLAKQRETTKVRMELAQDARWAADMYAEHVSVVDEDEETFTADLDLLAPVSERVGLLMLASGESTRVIDPASLVSAGLDVARTLLQHHEKSGGDGHAG